MATDPLGHPSSMLQQSSGSNSAMDSLTCQWANCGERCSSPEALYDHVCERHVGRKSTNNLNLQCQWGNCRTTTVKRDHITSHIRVHVPLKPHKCEFCGKSFKRPQDLKKHVKTHADESVLLGSSDANGAQRSHLQPHHGYQQQNSKPATNGYNYSQMAQGGHYGYHPGANGPYNYNGGGMPMNQGYGPVVYNVPQTANYSNGLTEARMRDHNALNEWIGTAKRRQIDPGQFDDLAARFGDWQTFGMPMQNSGGNLFMYDEQGGPAVAYQTAPPMTQFSELKTRNDLLNLEQFLEQLQNTLANQPIGAQQPLAMPMGASSNSPLHPGYASSPAHSTPADSTPGTFGTPTTEDVPALTPSSFHTNHSRDGSTSAPGFDRSPRSQPASAALYPSLPSISSLTDANSHGYSAAQGGLALVSPTSGAPPSSLADAYEDIDSLRRRNGARLGATAPQRPPSPRAAPASRRSSSGSGSADISRAIKNFEISSPRAAHARTKLPGIASITRREPSPERPRHTAGSTTSPVAPSSSSSSAAAAGAGAAGADARKDAYAQNMRFVRALRDYVRARLQRGDFERASPERGGGGGEHQATPTPTPQPQTQPQPPRRDWDRDGDRTMGGTGEERRGQSLYPMLRPVEAS